MLGMAWYCGKGGKQTIRDFTTASSTLGLFVLTLTFCATYHSSYAFMGAYGFAYQDGVGFWMNGLWTVFPSVLLWYWGRRFWFLGKKYGHISLSQFLNDAYGSNLLSLAVALITVFFTMPMVATQTMGVGYIFKTISKDLINYEVGAVMFLVLMVALVWLGGMKGVAWTDAAQGVLMFLGMIIGCYLVVKYNFPSFAEALQRTHEIKPELFTIPGPRGTITNFHWLSRWSSITIGQMMFPHLVLRYLSGKSLRILKWSAVSSAAYLTLIYFFTPSVGMIGNVLYPNMANSDLIFPTMLINHTNIVFASLMLCGALAASMSTADSQLHAVSSVITADIYKKYVPKASEKSQFNFARATIIGVGVISLVFAFQNSSMIADIQAAATGGVSVLAPCVMGSLYWKRSTVQGAWASIIIGETALAITTYWLVRPLGILPGLWGLIFAFISFVVVSMATKPRPRMVEIVEELNQFFCSN